MRDAGYHFGPSFQPQLEIEAVAGQRRSRALLSFVEPPSLRLRSPRPVYAVAIDGCLQSGAPSLWKGIRSAVRNTLVPAVIDDMCVNSRFADMTSAVAVSSSHFPGVGSSEEVYNYTSNIVVHDPATNRELVRIERLRYHKLDAGAEPSSEHHYMSLEWKPDIDFLTQEQLSGLFGTENSYERGSSSYSD
jgi:hypothetical protein